MKIFAYAIGFIFWLNASAHDVNEKQLGFGWDDGLAFRYMIFSKSFLQISGLYKGSTHDCPGLFTDTLSARSPDIQIEKTHLNGALTFSYHLSWYEDLGGSFLYSRVGYSKNSQESTLSVGLALNPPTRMMTEEIYHVALGVGFERQIVTHVMIGCKIGLIGEYSFMTLNSTERNSIDSRYFENYQYGVLPLDLQSVLQIWWVW